VLTTCYERGGMLSVLSLHGIFALIQNHNLEYAPFFTKLYALLDRHLYTHTHTHTHTHALLDRHLYTHTTLGA
jgi:hypothetical protein